MSESRLPRHDYRLGLSGTGREAVRHAVRADTENSLCGEEVYPLPICGWSLSFSPTAARAYTACVQATQQGSRTGR